PHYPHSFPTRRSSDLGQGNFWIANKNGVTITFPAGWIILGEDERGLTYAVADDHRVQVRVDITPDVRTDDPAVLANRARRIARRSEEHTSELQSRGHL